MNQVVNRRRTRWAVCAAVFLWWSVSTAVAESEQPDTSDWACKWCVFNAGITSKLDGGIGYVSDDSFKFGQYTGLGNEGMFAIVDGEGEYRGEDGGFWDLSAYVLGSDRISAEAGGGKQGRYDVFFSYDQFPNLIQDTTSTPFSGYDILQLPANWVRADTTGGMTELSSSLRPFDFETGRKRLGLGARFLPNKHWTTALQYRRDEQSGYQSIGAPIGGSLIAGFPFQTQSSLIAEPADSVTHLLDATVSFQSKQSHVNLGYQGSIFEQDVDSVTWQNPFNDLTGNGADAGRRALAPDNQFHQLYATLGHRFGATTRATARVAVGRMEQDATLLPYTINPGLQNSLPRNSADGEVNTHNYQLKISSRPARKLSFNADFTYNDRNNDTPRSTYDYVITDAMAAPGPRINRIYSFTNESIDLNGAYRISRAVRASLGYERKDAKRTLQQIENTIEDSLWGALALSPHATLDLDLRYARSERVGDEFRLVPDTDPPQNPLIRKYNMADRDRDAFRGVLSYTPGAIVGFGLTADYADDDYTESQLGLTEGDYLSVSTDLSINATPDIRINAYASLQNIKSTQVGSQTFSTPTWSAENKDDFETLGLTLNYEPMGRDISVHFDYMYSNSTGDVDIRNSLDPVSPFPENDTRLNRAELHLDYQMSDALTWRFGWIFEDYDSTDWALDGVNPDTIPNVLSLGAQAFSYSVHVPSVSVRYRF